MSTLPQDVRAAIDRVTPARRKRDAETLVDLFSRITGETAHLWARIIGFGTYHYKYESGREGDAPAAGFAPRKAATTIYLADGIGAYAPELEALGPHTHGVGCLYIKDLEAIDLAVLEDIVRSSYQAVTAGTFGHRARESGS